MSNDSKTQDTDWKEKLSDEEYSICREGGTEQAFTGCYWDCKTPGVYLCKCCAVPLFASNTKYDSGSGWPSFYQSLEDGRVRELTDNSLGRQRVEIRCSRCDSHLGHVFNDGPQPTGLRYCVNSASLTLKEEPKA